MSGSPAQRLSLRFRTSANQPRGAYCRVHGETIGDPSLTDVCIWATEVNLRGEKIAGVPGC
ncbi:hypothetical protein GCM10022295_31110 [Streptomyces osmaniensis]|uniref:Uncharacterized protein n=1 Tax=Streptomyces osmaniensis TaxID=593134 RepID=A0ABP6W855_9ACTN